MKKTAYSKVKVAKPRTPSVRPYKPKNPMGGAAKKPTGPKRR